MTVSEVVDIIRATSSHLEYASTTRNVLPWKGPARSMWTHAHGFRGVSQVFPLTAGVCVCAGLDSWHAWHVPTHSVMALSMCGHYM